MSEVPVKLRLVASGDQGGGPRVGVVDEAIGGPERFASLAALFPHVTFASAGPTWPDGQRTLFDILVVAVDASSPGDVDAAARRLRGGDARVVVILKDADVMGTRRLIREGAVDVLPGPPTEPALAACIERLLVSQPAEPVAERRAGEVVAFLKAGGGVGATALAAQSAAILASRGGGRVCLADFDLQFGAGGLYLDLPEAMTVDDVLGAGQGFAETPFASTLAAHRSGVHVLAAPRDIVPLESISSAQADSFMSGLKRDFALTIVDLPAVWTMWTSRVLQVANRVVLVTNLSVPHMHLVNRQIRLLASQGLETQPLILICNAVSPEQQSQVSLRAAEKALGRKFDVIVPEDRRVMNAAINEGLQISAVRRGTKLERAVAELADKVAAAALVKSAVRA